MTDAGTVLMSIGIIMLVGCCLALMTRPLK